MEREIHNDIDRHIIDITNDDDSSSGSSLDERSYSSPRSPLSTDGGEDIVESIGGTSSSTSGCDSIWNTMELVVTLVQIVAALVVMTLAKDERPQALLLTWLIGYTCGCITSTLLILSLRFRKNNQVGVYSRTRMDVVMEVLKMGVESFFVVWLVLGIVWICDGHSSPSNVPKLYRLCVVFIAFSCIRYTFAVLLCAGEGLGGGFVYQRPRHDDVSKNIVTYYICLKNLVYIISMMVYSVVAYICLGKYGEEERAIRKLECSHVFHLECVEKWLKIKATCPLCQSQVRW